MNRWHGPVAKLDEDTTDHRRITTGALDLDEAAGMPLVHEFDVRSFERRPKGYIDHLEVHGNVVHGEGWVDLEPGTHGAALQLTWRTDGIHTEEGATRADNVFVIDHAEIVGLLLGTTPAWPDCVVTVEP